MPRPHRATQIIDELLEEIATEPANYGSKLVSNARKVQKLLPLVETDKGMCDLLGNLIDKVADSTRKSLLEGH